MAVTRLQRKEKKLKTRASKRQKTLKRFNKKPTIKNVDIEELKKSFGTNKSKSDSTKASGKKETSEDKTTDKKAGAESKKEE